MSYDLRDISRNFKARKKKPHTWTWRKRRDGENIQAICDYILAGNKVQFTNFVNSDVAFNNDHRLLTGKLKSEHTRVYRKYITERKSISIPLFPEHSLLNDNSQDSILKNLTDSIPKVKQSNSRDRSWISKNTFQALRRKN